MLSAMANFIRWLFGAPTIHDTHCRHLYVPYKNIVEEPSPDRERGQPNKPFSGLPVPLETDMDPDDYQGFYDDFYERFNVVVANNKTSVLLYPETFASEEPSTGKARYYYWPDDDGDSPQDRLEGTARIYEQLSANGPLPRCLVQYQGRHPSGVRLERLEIGPLDYDLPSAEENDVVLALYQRWALQTLSALRFLHENCVILNAIDLTGLWIREDLSAAIANLVNAGSEVVGVSAGDLRASEVESQWSPDQFYPSRSVDEVSPGHIKGDLFDWAVLAFELFKDESLMDYTLPPEEDKKHHTGLWLRRSTLR